MDFFYCTGDAWSYTVQVSDTTMFNRITMLTP